MMTDKFSIDEYLIKIMPGGLLILIFWLSYGNCIPMSLTGEYDILLTFIFLCLSYIAGEILQTIAHSFDFIMNIRFKFRKPSEVFLYKNNPVIKNEHKRKEIISLLKVKKEEKIIFDKEYSSLNWLKFRKINKKHNNLLQNYFWTIYGAIKNNPEIKQSNSNYLFLRAVLFDCIILDVFLFYCGYYSIGGILLFLILILFWRIRGLARGLVFNSVLSYLNKMKGN